MKVKFTGNLLRNGKLYSVGDVVEASQELVDELLAIDVIEVVATEAQVDTPEVAQEPEVVNTPEEVTPPQEAVEQPTPLSPAQEAPGQELQGPSNEANVTPEQIAADIAQLDNGVRV